MMIRIPDVYNLQVEGAYEKWNFVAPLTWTHLETSGNCLAFFGLPDGAKVGLNAFWFKGCPWIHASISRPDRMPDYDDLCMLHKTVFGDEGFSAQMFVPSRLHVNIHSTCLHLWGPLNPKKWPMPILGEEGTI